MDDPSRLMEYAKERYEDCWGELDEELDMDTGQALLEALVLSNENPSPDEYGIEILKWVVGPAKE